MTGRHYAQPDQPSSNVDDNKSAGDAATLMTVSVIGDEEFVAQSTLPASTRSTTLHDHHRQQQVHQKQKPTMTFPYGDHGLNVPPSPALSNFDGWSNSPPSRHHYAVKDLITTNRSRNAMLHSTRRTNHSHSHNHANNISWSSSTASDHGAAESFDGGEDVDQEDVSKLTFDDSTDELASPWPGLVPNNNHNHNHHHYEEVAAMETMVPWPDADDEDVHHNKPSRGDDYSFPYQNKHHHHHHNLVNEEKKIDYDYDNDGIHYDTDYTDDPRSMFNGLTDDDNTASTDNIDTILGYRNDHHHLNNDGNDSRSKNDGPSCYADYYDAKFQQHRRKFPLRDDTVTGPSPPSQRTYPQSQTSPDTPSGAATSAAAHPHVTPSSKPNAAPGLAGGASASSSSGIQDRIAQIESNMKLVEDHVALFERLLHLEDCMKRRDEEMQLLQDALIEQYEHETTSVSWKIPQFEKKLIPGQRHFFESSTFVVCGRSQPVPFFLTVCVLEVDDHVPESKRPVAIFIKSALNRKKDPSSPKSQSPPRSPSKAVASHGFDYKYDDIFPLRLDGSSLTLVGNGDGLQERADKTIQVGEATMDDPSQGKGLRHFVSLGELRTLFLQDDASVIVKATIRIPRLHTVQLETLQ